MKNLLAVVLALFMAAQCWGQCDTYIPIPYNEPMTDLPINDFPPCWTKLYNNTSSYPKIAAVSSENALTFMATATGQYATAITNSIDPSIDIASLQVKFDLRRMVLMGTPASIQIWIGTDASDWSSFTLVATKTNTANDTWEAQVVDLNNYNPAPAPNGYYIALHLQGAASQFSSLYVKNFQIVPAPSCPDVLGFTVMPGSSNEAIVSWDTTTDNTAWILAYSETSADQFDVTTAIRDTLTAADMPLHVNNLVIGSTYTFTMQAICPSINGTWLNPVEIILPAVMTLDYNQDFEDLSNVPEWEFVSNSVNKWHIGDATGNGGNSLYISNDSASYDYSNVSTFAYASFNVYFGNYSNYNLSFQWKGIGVADWTYMRVYIVPVNQVLPPAIGSWPPAQESIQIGGDFSGQTEWQSFSSSIDSAAVANTTKKVVFIWRNSASSYNPPPMAIDNISIIGSLCAAPTDLSIDSTANGMLALSWTSDASTFVVKYGEYGFDINNEGTEEFVTTNSIVIENLNNTLFYDIYVKTSCDNSEESAWTLLSAMQPNSYLMGTSGYRNITTCSGIIYDDGGYFNNYSHNCSAVLSISPANEGEVIQLTGTYQIQSGDLLSIYDGITTSGTPLVTLTSNSVATLAPVTSSSGSLTLVFTSNSSTSNSGFALNANCVACAVPANITVVDNGNEFVTLAWTGLASNYEIEYGLHGFTPGNGTILSVMESDTITITGLTNLAAYDFYIKSDCGNNQYSMPVLLSNVIVNAYIMPLTGSGTLSHCGITIYDNGGPSNNYSNWSNFTLVVRPEEIGQFVTLSGTFSAELNSDFLYVYDGEVADPDHLLATLTGNLGTITPIISNSGSLTLYFTSDYDLGYSGFALLVTCISCPTPSQITTTVANATTATISWLATEAISYNVEFGYTGFTPGTGTMINVADNSITLDTLTPSANYDIYIQTNCDANNVSAWSEVAHFGTFACLNPCTYTLVARTSGSGGWDRSKLIFMQNGVAVAEKTLPADQYMENIDVPLCQDINTELIWHREHSALLDFNLSFTLIAPSGDTVIHITNPSLIANNAVFHTFMSSCTGPCLQPTNVTVSLLTANSASVSWDDSGAPEWQVEYQIVGEAAWTVVTPNPTTPSVIISDLTDNGYYMVRVKGICDDVIQSVYSDVVTFNTICPPPSNVTSSNVNATSATISWMSTDNENQWELGYKTTVASNWQSVIVSVSPFTLNGLSAGSCYDVRIRALCGQNNVSIWTVATELFCTPVSIPAVTMDNSLIIYPNPVVNELRIMNCELWHGDKIEIYNMLGIIQQLSISHIQPLTINVSHLPSGMYMLKMGNKIGKFVKE